MSYPVVLWRIEGVNEVHSVWQTWEEMTSWGLDLLSKLAESTSLDALREDFPRKSDEGLNPTEFLAVVHKHIGQEEFSISTTSGSAGGHSVELDDVASRVGEVFKQIDVRGDGDVCWQDFSAFVLQLELLHDGKGAGENEKCFKPFAAHLGVDGRVRGGGVARVEYLPAPVGKLGLVEQGNEVVHLLGQGPFPDNDDTPFRVESGGASDLARISCSLRHDTAYKQHEVNAVHSVPGQDVVITSSSLGPTGPHFLTVWDLPTEEERTSEKQFMPALTSREETPTRQTKLFWAPAVEMILTGSSGNGALLGWDMSPVKQTAKLWLHDAGITHVHELVGHAGGAPHLVTASLDGTIAVCGAATRRTRAASTGGVILQRLQAHERGVALMAFCLHHSLVLSAGVFVNAFETTPDILVWRLDRYRGLLEQDINTRLKGHEDQVVGIAFIEEDFEVITGGVDGTFFVWDLPSLIVKQRFTRSHSSPLADQSVSCFAMVPKAVGRPPLLVAGMLESGGLELFARMEQRIHEALIKAEFCAYLQRFVTVSGRRATVWDGKTGEALTTLASERLLGDAQAEITAFSLDHQGHKLVVGADSGDIRACFSHSGSIVRELDPHDGPVNWLSFASRKTDKCVFSIGGDGALHVLDDADAKGYVKASKSGNPSRNPWSRAVRAMQGRHVEGRPPRRGTPPLPPTGGTSRSCRKDQTAGERGQPTSDCEPEERDRVKPLARERKHGSKHEEGLSLVEPGRDRAADGGHSVLLRRVTLSSIDSNADEEGESSRSRGSSAPLSCRNWSAEAPQNAVVSSRPRDAGAHAEDRAGIGDTSPASGEDSASETRVTSVSARVGVGGGSDVGGGERDSQSSGITEASSSSCGENDGTVAEDSIALTTDGQNITNSVTSSGNTRFLKAARALMSPGARDEILEREVGAGNKENGGHNSLLAKPTHDMVACAADDHLNLIATATTSNGGIVKLGQPTGAADPDGENKNRVSSRGGGISSTVHLWDAEMMALLGTLLFPSVALMRDLANAAAAFGNPSAQSGSAPAAETRPDPTGPHETPPDMGDGEGVAAATNAAAGPPLFVGDAPKLAPAPDAPGKRSTAMTAVNAGNGHSRPVLLTALEFLAPYPLLAGASTGGAIALWRVSDFVCVQAILLPANISSLRRRSSGACEVSRKGASAEGERHFTCLAKGKCSSASGEDAVALYVGNERGDILVAHLPPWELEVLSGEAAGPVPCQRRPNHNPYRAVRVKLTPQMVANSLRAACRIQRKASLTSGLQPGAREPPRHNPKDSATYNFAVPSSGFNLAWSAHSAAVSSISWIESPPSLLSASADGLAKIWTPDGSNLLGQLDINHKRPDNALSTQARGWAFVPVVPKRHRSDESGVCGVRSPGFDANPVATGAEDTSTKSSGGGRDRRVDCNKPEDFDKGPRGGDGGEVKERRPRRQQQGPHQQGKPLVGEGETNGGVLPPASTMRFPTSDTEMRGDHTAEPGAQRRKSPGSPSGSSTRRRRAGVKTANSRETTVVGGGSTTTWTSGWDGMARQLQDFEEKLEASSWEKRAKGDAVATGMNWSSPSDAAVTGRKTPLYGKRWRTKSPPWLAEGDGVEASMAEEALGRAVAAGSARAITTKIGGRGYVRPRPGTAEEAAVNRARNKDATGVVTKDTATGLPATAVSVKGRPLEEWLTLPQYGDGVDTESGRKTRAGQGMERRVDGECYGPSSHTNYPSSAMAMGAVVRTKGGVFGAIGSSAKELPPMAILAGSRGGRLVASGISIAGDRGGGGFNIKIARAAARDASQKAAAASELRKGERGGGGKGGWRSPPRAIALRQRKPNQGRGHWDKRGGKVSAWVWGKGKPAASRSTAPSKSAREIFGGAGEGSTSTDSKHGSGTSLSQGSASARGSRTEGSSSVGLAGEAVGVAFKKTRGLNSDSVIWAPSRRMPQTSASTKGRKDDGASQGETIRRLVHMGLF